MEIVNIFAKIRNIQYAPFYGKTLKTILKEDFNINSNPSSFILQDESENYGISKWVSPKRTRSYPFGRVYDTLKQKTKITIIPLVKDEGAHGDIDLLQWDTISLMSLLNVYVIIGYYNKAIKKLNSKDKITQQQFSHDHIFQKLEEFKQYQSSALHWNLKEIEESIPNIIEKVIDIHEQIEKNLNVRLHPTNGLVKLGEKLGSGLNSFRDYSRKKAILAQNREINMLQPKEFLMTETKATINIENYLGGIYHLTVDEVCISGKTVELIESKHTVNHILPSDNDIKDGLIKMVLFTNLENITINNSTIDVYEVRAILQLTSSKIEGELYTPCSETIFMEFVHKNKLTEAMQTKLSNLLSEAAYNNFEIRILSQTSPHIKL